jgi:hypothetical protein
VLDDRYFYFVAGGSHRFSCKVGGPFFARGAIEWRQFDKPIEG